MLPYSEGALLHQLTEQGTILEQEYRGDGVFVKVRITISPKLGSLQAKLDSFQVDDQSAGGV